MKRAISVLLGVIMSVMLCACGQKASAWQEQYDLGVRYLSEGNYEEAIIAFTAAIDIDSKRTDAYIGRGDAYIGSGETEENLAAALEDYQSALELDDTRADAYLGLADVYIRQGEYGKAQDILEKGVEKTRDQSIADKISEIESGIFLDSSSNVRRVNEYNESHELAGYSTTTYNEYGSIQRSSSYDQNGNLLYYHTYTYWKDNLRREKVFTYLADGSLMAYERYEYDISGKQIGEYFYNGDEALQQYRLTEYNSAGRPSRTSEYNGDGTSRGYYVYEWDGDNPTKYYQYDEDGRLTRTIIDEYDDKGNHVKQSCYGSDGALEYYYTYEYDKDGNMVQQNEYAGDGKLSRYWSY